MLLSLPRLLTQAAGFAGLAGLLAAVLFRWFLVPGEPNPDGLLPKIEPTVTWLFRGLCLATVLAAAVAWKAPHRLRQHGVRIAGALLLALLLYPTAILHTAPNLAARSAWLWNQHDQLTGYAGDIFTSQEVRDATWQQRIQIVNAPIQNRIFKLPAWSPLNLEWSRLIEITEWLGLTAWFAQGLARGWVLAVAGAALLLLARSREREIAEPGFVRRSIPGWLGGAALVIALATVPFLICGQLVARARELVQSGQSAAALTTLKHAAQVLPAIREDGAYFLQIGLLEAALNRPTPAAALYRARKLAEDGFAQQAQAAMIAALPTVAPSSVAQRELEKGLLVSAIDELNSGQIVAASRLLQSILVADPCNLKANYALQIAAVRTGDLEALRGLSARMKQTYRFLNTPMKRAVLATSYEHLAFAEITSGTPSQALAQQRNSKRLPK